MNSMAHRRDNTSMQRRCLLLLLACTYFAEFSNSFSTAPTIAAGNLRRYNVQSYSRRIGLQMETTQKREVLLQRMPEVSYGELSDLQIEFRHLLEGIVYSNEEINAIPFHNFRAILEGVSASYYQPAVYRAFEVLFEDHTPLRLAGRAFYRKIRDAMENSVQERRREFAILRRRTNLSEDDIQKSWLTYGNAVGGFQTSRKVLKNSIVPRIREYFVNASDEDLIKLINPDNARQLTFSEVILGLQACVGAFSPHDLAILPTLMDFEIYNNVDEATSAKTEKYNQRYNDMVAKFEEWAPYIPSGEGRRLDILRGCFVGSKSPEVVEALRIIYTDNAALRMAGDWIFKVVAAIMTSVLSRQ